MDNTPGIKKGLHDRGFRKAFPTQPPNPKRLIAQQIDKAIARQGLTRAEVAARMKTSRASLARLLDSDNPSVTLQTLEAAAEALDLEIIISIKPRVNT